MANISLDNVTALKPAKDWGFDLQFVTLPANLSAIITSEELRLRCQQVPLPDQTNHIVSGTLHGHTFIDFGNEQNSGTIAFTFLETLDGIIEEFFDSWQNLCQNKESGDFNDKEDIIAEIKVRPLKKDGTAYFEYHFIGCICNNFSSGTMCDGAGGGAFRYPVLTVTYEQFRKKKV